MQPPIRIVLVDDHRHIHELVTMVVANAADVLLVGHGSNGDEAVLLCQEHNPDVLLLDVLMPGTDGREAARIIQSQQPHIKVLALSSFQDDDSVRTMLEHGAVGYVLKGALADDLLPSIRAAIHGTTVISRSLIPSLLKGGTDDGTDAAPTNPASFGLTAREIEVLKLMAEGNNNGQIAERLVISQSTVKYHITNILLKLGVETRSEAIVIAAKNDLV